ncbi:Arc family DNA-binding protein [Pseudomonas sp. V88_4]|uniref:Arc family DNA-binding protein n=1 Tax=Pseudomonas sp. V88_4 TaxID=3044229 RepID=UPI00249ED571|nr:Arc family DNA-binding protein [Pseudomonas sp. V88_4]MDI3399631.1 Arc family DNA-binding protein [Pseudomonas sp. V88_4]
MSTKQFDSRTADKFVARLPDGLRAEIEAIANGSDRSMNAVFVQAVRQYTDGQKLQQLLLDSLANSVALASAVTDTMHIDDRVRMAANARRYEWLRDRQIIEDPDTDLLVTAGDTYFTGAELDKYVDDAIRAESLEASPCEH